MPDFHTQMLQVRNNALIVWYRPEYDWNSKFKHGQFLIDNFKNKKTYSGMITDSTKKRMTKAIELLLQTSPNKKVENPFTKHVINHRLSFITLTIADTKKNYTPNEGYRLLLKPFLRYFRESNLMKTYIWKAEFQERGQLHYHITTNAVIDFRIIRKHWNALQIKNSMLDDYFIQHQHYDPNSIDIHQVHKLHNIQAYLIKYLTKTTQNQQETKGKIWGCSDNLQGKSLYSVELNNTNAHKIQSAYKAQTISIKDLEMCSIINCETISPKQLLDNSQKADLTNFLVNIRDNNPKNLL
jgi:hypothetical protein